MHVGIRIGADAAAAIHAGGGNEHVLGFAPVGTAIHAQGAADRTRNAAQKRQAADRGVLGGTRHFHVRHRGAGADARTGFHLDIGEAAAKADHHARHAAVPNDEIGAEPDDGDRDVHRQMPEERAEIVFVLRDEQQLCRPPDPEPGQIGERLIGEEPAAQPRRAYTRVGGQIRKGAHFIHVSRTGKFGQAGSP